MTFAAAVELHRHVPGPRPGFDASLVGAWLPALDGVVPRLDRGALAAVVGCGEGASTILLAKAFPRTIFVGSDPDVPSVCAARRAARDAGVGDRVRFEAAPPTAYRGRGYDLVALFGHPDLAAARHVRETVAHDGTWLIVAPGGQPDVRPLAARAGFAHVRLVDRTPFVVVLEAR